MNESAGDQITELLNDDLLLPDTDSLDTTDDPDEEPPVRTIREGLPRSFRMRHDAHYVDALMERATDGPPPIERDQRGRPAPEPVAAPDRRDKSLAVSVEVAAPAPAVPAAALSLIAARLESVVAHAAALRPHQATPLLIAQSVEAEFARVARLARAAAILQDRDAPRRSSVSARDIADRVMIACAPVARMGGLACEVSVDDPAFTILAEAAQVIQGIAGTVDAIVDLLLGDPRRPSLADGRDPAPRLSISLQSVKVRPALIIDVICPSLFIGSRQAERFFDPAADDYRAAPAAGILLAAAAQVARAHGGRADVKRHNGSGATIAYVFPQAVADHGLT